MMQGSGDDSAIEPGIAEHLDVGCRCYTSAPEQFPVIRGPHRFERFTVQPVFGSDSSDIEDNAAFEPPAVCLPDHVDRVTPGRDDAAALDINAQKTSRITREIISPGLSADNIFDMIPSEKIIR